MDAAAFRSSITDRLKSARGVTGRSFDELAREFTLQRFLARVFADRDSPWILKGGGALLVRLPGARYSRDLDLLHGSSTLREAAEELRDTAEAPGADPFSFTVGEPRLMTGGVNGATLPVVAYLGAARFQTFSVDLSTELHAVAAVEVQRPRPVIDVPGLGPLPDVRLYPLPDQLADKVCAMYEHHGPARAESTRFRDLVDILLITGTYEVDAATTAAALQQESSRRQLSLPSSMVLPGNSWSRGYPALARTTSLPSALHSMAAALTAAGRCFDPILKGELAAGTWSPQEQSWLT